LSISQKHIHTQCNQREEELFNALDVRVEKWVLEDFELLYAMSVSMLSALLDSGT
jgi:hypothetical protein